MYKILTLNKISESGLSLLPTDKYSYNGEEANPDGIILRSFSMHEMELPGSLKAVARAGAGVNNIPIDKCTNAGVVVFNTPGANANAVKELVIAGMLISSRKVAEGIAWVQSLKDQKDVAKLVEKGKGEYVGPEITGKKMGVIGLGAIGLLVANACVALGMQVYGYDPFITTEAAWKLDPKVTKAPNLDTIYQDCDYISLHVPLLPDTKEMINKNTIAACKKGVRILNFSRADLANDEDVKTALKEGKLGAYVTDFPTENVLGVDGIVPIPHLGASTPESEDNCAAMASMELRGYLEFGQIKNSVNFPDVDLAYTGKKRICVLHKNDGAMVGKFTDALSSEGLNLSDMMNKSKGNNAYTVLDIADNDPKNIADTISKIDGVINVRII